MNLIGHVLNTDLFYSIERKCTLIIGFKRMWTDCQAYWLFVCVCYYCCMRHDNMTTYQLYSTKSIDEREGISSSTSWPYDVAHLYAPFLFSYYNTYSWIRKVMCKLNDQEFMVLHEHKKEEYETSHVACKKKQLKYRNRRKSNDRGRERIKKESISVGGLTI